MTPSEGYLSNNIKNREKLVRMRIWFIGSTENLKPQSNISTKL
jgi:hypothetical protein